MVGGLYIVQWYLYIIYLLGKSVEIFEVAFSNRVNLERNIQTTDRFISKYSFPSPIVARNLHVFNLPLVPLQIQVYGTNSPVGKFFIFSVL